jgi:uncharacterized protein (DUF1684 family)
MNMRFFFPALRALPALMIVLAVGCSSPKPDDKDYASQVAADRAYKDAMFLKGDDPVPQNKKADLLPLAYFPIDPEYNVPASLKPSDDQTVIPMPTSSGSPRQMRKAGTLEFTLKGQPFSITAFVDLSDRNLDHLTVMFSDLTSGTETYNSGRYIDLNRSPTGVYALDFNRAYHPYCYYNGSYECPIPPPENRLKIPIRAGERLKSEKEKAS